MLTLVEVTTQVSLVGSVLIFFFFVGVFLSSVAFSPVDV